MLDLFLSVLGISALIFAIVAGLIWRAIVVGRKRADLPVQEFGSERKEIFWMIGPTIIVLWIVAISVKLILTMNAIPRIHPAEDMPADVELRVTGHQWWWEIRYPGTDIVAANEIHIPIGKKIRVKLTSADVIHCFWVPQLARKIDVIPGHENYIWLEANKPGVYQGRCAEFCGNQHAWMNFQVFALDPADYAKWLAGGHSGRQAGGHRARRPRQARKSSSRRCASIATRSKAPRPRPRSAPISPTSPAATSWAAASCRIRPRTCGVGCKIRKRSSPAAKCPISSSPTSKSRQVAAYLESLD